MMRVAWAINPCGLVLALVASLGLCAASANGQNGLSALDTRAVFVNRPAETGLLVGIDGQWNIKLQAGEKVRVVAASELVYWGAYRDREAGPQFILVDGSVVRADLLDFGPDELTLGDATGLGRCLWDEATVSRSAVRGIVLQPPADALDRDRLIDQTRTYRQTEDQLLLLGGETINGRLQQAPRSGRFLPANEPPAEAYVLARRGMADPLSVPASKVVALFFGSVAADPPPGANATAIASDGGMLGFRDGSLLHTRQVVAKGDTIEFALAAGCALSAPLDQSDEQFPTIWRQITWLQPQNDRVAFLTQLQPLGYKHVPLLTLEWPYGADRNVLQGALRSGGSVYSRGVGMHSASRLAYSIDAGYRRFEAELALDDAAELRGSVTFKVLVEREPGAWSTAYESPVLRGGDAPLPISVDLKGARRLALIVDFADRGDEQDHANWLMARLVK